MLARICVVFLGEPPARQRPRLRAARAGTLAGRTAPRSDRGPSICFSFIRPNFKPMSCTRDPRLASAGQEIDAVVPLKRDTCKVWKIFITASERGPRDDASEGSTSKVTSAMPSAIAPTRVPSARNVGNLKPKAPSRDRNGSCIMFSRVNHALSHEQVMKPRRLTPCPCSCCQRSLRALPWRRTDLASAWAASRVEQNLQP